MQRNMNGRMTRRRLLMRGAFAAAALSGRGRAQGTRALEIAAAGSIRGMLDGALKTAAAKALGLDLHTQSQGADTVARAIVAGSLQADVFLPITAGPMLTVLRGGKAHTAYPIAKTEMVILYSPKSRFAASFAAAAAGQRSWWEVLEQPGVRFARSNPLDDPSGRSILFAMMLAAKTLKRPDLVQRILGDPLNPAQVRPGTEIRAGLGDGSVDAIGGYKIGGGAGKLPYIPLPQDVNLTDAQVRANHPDIVLEVNGQTFYPEPLLFYAAAMRGAANPDGAARFLDWVRGPEAAALFTSNGFALPGNTAPLTT